jgi:hypothetical protein
MKKLLTRGLLGLAALAVPAAAALASPLAASAAPSSSTTCNNGYWNQYGNVTITNPLPSVVKTNLVVPTGAVCGLSGNEVQGNVDVQGSLVAYGGVFDKNVSVTGGLFKSVNEGVTINGNLSFLDPAPGSYNGFWGNQFGTTNVVKGNLSYTIDSSTSYPMYNSPLLYFGGGTTVNGNLSYSDQGTGWTGHVDQTGLNVLGNTSGL